MAYYGQQIIESFTMNDSSTAKQYYCVKLTTTADTVALTTASGERAIGIIQDQVSTGGTANVVLFGVTKANHDGTCTVGAAVQASSGGNVMLASTATGIYRIGQALNVGSTAAGTIITILLGSLGQSTN